MIGFLCIFFPSVIAVAITAKVRKEIFRFDQYLIHYAVFTVIINGIMFWILSFMFDQHSISAPDVFTTSFSAKYILLSSFLAVVLGYAAESLRRIKSLSKDQSQEEEIQKNTDKNE
jgi:uncharacterized membrane protein YvlD (DUF360 family)